MRPSATRIACSDPGLLHLEPPEQHRHGLAVAQSTEHDGRRDPDPPGGVLEVRLQHPGDRGVRAPPEPEHRFPADSGRSGRGATHGERRAAPGVPRRPIAVVGAPSDGRFRVGEQRQDGGDRPGVAHRPEGPGGLAAHARDAVAERALQAPAALGPAQGTERFGDRGTYIGAGVGEGRLKQGPGAGLLEAAESPGRGLADGRLGRAQAIHQPFPAGGAPLGREGADLLELEGERVGR